MIFRKDLALFLAYFGCGVPTLPARWTFSGGGRMLVSAFQPVRRVRTHIPLTNTQLYSSTPSAPNTRDSDATGTKDVTETIRLQSYSQMSLLQSNFPSLRSSIQLLLPKLLSTPGDVSTYIDDNIDAILFDCDGVLYRGNDAIPNAASALSSLVARGKQIFFVTNNAGSNRQQLRDKLAELLHSDTLRVEQMVTSSYSAARYLQRELISGDRNEMKQGDDCASKPRVHVIGTAGLCAEIASAGFEVQGGPADEQRAGMTRQELASYPFPDFADPNSTDARVDAFVVGLDNDFNYRKLCIANVLMQHNPGAVFVATNEDAYDLVGVHAYHLPGNGALVKALEHCSGRKAVCVGKPSPLLAELIVNDHGLNVGRTLFVGDRLDTDIRFAVESGMKSALVLTGCVTAERVMELCSEEDTGRCSAVEEPMPSVIFPHMGMMGDASG